MGKQRSDIAHRAWNILRLALLWARKGGLFKRRFLTNLNDLCPKLDSTTRSTLHYGEREFSFDNTPILHIKMHRPSSMRFRMPTIPCLTPQVDFEDCDFELNRYNDEGYDSVVSYCNEGRGRESILMGGDYEEEEEDRGEVWEEMSLGDEGIDHKAEQFIAKFYEQMKLQRQTSYLQYHEMLHRSTS